MQRIRLWGEGVGVCVPLLFADGNMPQKLFFLLIMMMAQTGIILRKLF